MVNTYLPWRGGSVQFCFPDMFIGKTVMDWWRGGREASPSEVSLGTCCSNHFKFLNAKM